MLRRSGRAAEKQQLIRVGGLEMNLGEHIVTADGIRIQLTLKEFELLHTFMTSPGRAFTREQLLSSVWSEDFLGETRTVDVHVGTLRQKLGSCGKYIRTVRGVGYKLEDVAYDRNAFFVRPSPLRPWCCLRRSCSSRACNFTSIFQTIRWIS